MFEAVTFLPLAPEDLFAIERQPSQRMVLGVPGDFSEEEAELLASQRIAWKAVDGDPGSNRRILACFGITEPFEGVQGIAWSLLASGIGAAHLPLTRFCRKVVARCALRRVEVICRAADLGEPGPRASGPSTELRTGMEVALAMHRRHVTPECRWAARLGFRPAHFLYRYGAKSEPHMLFEWFPEMARAN